MEESLLKLMPFVTIAITLSHTFVVVNMPKQIYDFASLRVGQSFDCIRDMGHDSTGRDKRQRTVLAAAASWKKSHKNDLVKFTVKVLNPAIVRCTRVR